jgi:hypothetical protein
MVDCYSRWIPDSIVGRGLRGLSSAGAAVKAEENTSREALDKAHAAALAPFAKGDGSYEVRAVFRWSLAAA